MRHAPPSARRRPLTALLVLLLVSAMATWLPSASAVAVLAEGLSLSQTASEAVLVGDVASVELTAHNDGDVAEYNLSFRAALPLGVSYVAGSTTPAGAGEPRVVVLPSGQQVLVWINASDLPVGARQTIAFGLRASAETWPVASTFTGTADAFASADPRTVPRFSSTGTYQGGASVQASADPASTTVTALDVVKSEPSPESELLRGIHDHPTTYTLTVTANDTAPVDDVVLVDLLPAGLEFLGCGTADNTPEGAVEYPGAPRLDSSTPDVDDCRPPDSVDTVTDPEPGLPGVHTALRWRLGTLAPGEVVRIVYAAGIPQRENTATFPGGTPTPTSLDQAANLANNTGPTTRETSAERGLTNRVRVSGEYDGPVAWGGTATVTDTDELTVTAEDLAVQKSVDTATFAQGGVATYTLHLSTGEYASAADVVLTDLIPNGLCPLGGPGINPTSDALDDCAGSDALAPGLSYDGITENADGTFEVVFAPVSLAADEVRTISYRARMLESYRRSLTDPTVAGDAFVNTVSLTGDTTTLAGVDPPGGVTTERVGDDSSATISGSTLLLDKRIQPRLSLGEECSEDPADYENDDDLTEEQRTNTEGSVVCFLLRVRFPAGSETKNAVLADFLPAELDFDPGSAQPLPGNDVEVDFDDASLQFSLGGERGTDRFVPRGSTFLYRIAGVVTASSSHVTPDVTGNLAKLRWTSTDGTVGFLRDRVELWVAPVPPVTVAKTASRVVATAPGVTGPLPDGGSTSAQRVRAGDVVDFTVTVGNDGEQADGSDQDVLGPEVWDRLPRGVTCAMVSATSDGGTCSDPGDPGRPAVDDSVRSVIRWDRPPSVVLAPGGAVSLTYRVTYPLSVAAARAFVNDVDVRDFSTSGNTGSLVVHLPADNVDTSVAGEDEDAPAAHDSHTLLTPEPSVAKTNDTEVADAGQGTNPVGLNYVTPGETVTYTVTATLPAATTVYSGVLSDAAPAGIRVDSVDYSFREAPTSAWGPLPDDFTASAGTPGVTFPPTHPTGSDDDQVRMIVTATVLGTGNTHGTVRTNTATLTSRDDAGVAVGAKAATSSVTVVEPNAVLAKAASPTGPAAGQTVHYTLTASDVNASSTSQMRSPLHDARVVDCVPVGLAVDAGSLAASQGTAAVAAVGTEGCAQGRTPIVWQAGQIAWRAVAALGANPWPTLKYDAVVDPAAAGGTVYTNTALLSGSSMAGADGDEKSYSANATKAVTVPGGTVSKSVTPSRVAVGARATYTVAVDLPADVNFYDAILVDTLPTGIPPSSLVLTGTTCTYPDQSACSVALTAAAALVPSATAYGWYFGDLVADHRARHVTVTYTAEVADEIAGNTAGKTLTNSARVKWNLLDTQAPETKPAIGATFTAQTSTASANVVVSEPSVSATKSVDHADPVPGQQFTYTVRLTNAPAATTSPAHDIAVRDTVPAGVRVVPGSVSSGGTLTGGEAGGGTVDWSGLGPIAPGATLTLTYDATLTSPPPNGTRTNTADVTRYTSLPVTDGGGRVYDGPTASASVTPGLPRLQVTTTALDTPSYLGEPSRWSVRVTNTGPATAYDVDVRDVLPFGWAYDASSARVSVEGATATAVEPQTVVGDDDEGATLTWEALADLPAHGVLVLTFTATPATSLAPDLVGADSPHVNGVSVTGQDLDGEDGSVVTSASTTASTHVDSADLVMTKEAVGAPVAGEETSWTLRVTNAGPDAAAGPVEVTDTLPAGLTGVAASGAGWACSVAAGDADGPAAVTCVRADADDILVDGDAFPAITVAADVSALTEPGTTLLNAAGLSGHTYDPEPGNDEDLAESTVSTMADLGVATSLGGDLVPGAHATYVLSVHNHGPSVARGPLTVSDTLPPGLVFVAAQAPGWDLTRQGSELTFTWAGSLPVPVGPLSSIGIEVAVDPDVTGAVENTATVTEPTDPTSGAEEPDSSTATTDPAPSADLVLAKSSPEEFLAGSQGVWDILVADRGPSDAAGPVTVTDTLPAGTAYAESTSDDDWTCDADGRDVTCVLPDGLTAGSSSALSLVVDIDESLDGAVVNTATVAGPTPDPHLPNGSDSDDTGIEVEADLRLDKDLLTGPVVAGRPASYRLTATNGGPATSPGPLTLSDSLPDGLSFVTATGDGWSCDTAGQEVTCTREGGLPADRSAPPVTVVADVASGVGATTLTNVGSVTGPATDPDPGDDTDSAPTPVTEDTEVVVDQRLTDAGPVVAGEDVAFEVVVSVAGPSDARDVTVTDLLPDGLTLIEAGGDGWSCDGPVCVADRVEAGGESPILTVAGRVDPGVAPGATLTNTATVTTSTPGDLPAGNEDEAEVSVTAVADLDVDKGHEGAEAGAGTSTSYRIRVRNLGPSVADGPLEVRDTLPEGMGFLSAGEPWACEPDGGQVLCTLDDGLAVDQEAPSLDLQVVLAADAIAGEVTNTATVSGPTPDEAPGNDTDTAEVTVRQVADLSVTKRHEGPVHIGEPVSFTLEATNGGPSEARGVRLSDTLPRGLEPVSAEGEGWDCELAGDEVTCTLDDVLGIEQTAAPVRVVANVTADGYPTVANVAAVAADTADPDPVDDEATDEVAVPALVDLSLTKTHHGPFTVGARGRYTLSVANDGPTADPGPLRLHDPLPASLRLVSAEGDGWSCGADEAQVVSCEYDAPLEVGATTSVDVVVDVLPAAYPQVVNTATVGSDAEEVDAEDGTARDTATVAPQVDLGIEKEVVRVAEDSVEYEITVTSRGSNATVSPVEVVDPMPSGLRLVSAAGVGWSCASSPARTRCVYADPLQPGERASLRLVADVAGSATGMVTNVATVAGGGDPGRGEDDATVVVRSGGDTDGPGDPGGPGVQGDPGGGLPDTGGPALWLGMVGAGLVIGGGALLLRRRREAQRNE